MKKRTIRHLRGASKSDHGLKKMGRTKPRKGPDELVDLPVEKITSLKRMTRDSMADGNEDEDDMYDNNSEDMEEDDEANTANNQKKVGVIGK